MKEYKVTGVAELKIVGENGEVIREIKKKNTDTLVSKLNIPTEKSLYMDLITKPLDSFYGLPKEKFIKTVTYDVTLIRSGKVSVGFSYNSNSKRYIASFTWGNTTSENVTLYGLVSYTSFNNINIVMTILDLTTENIIIGPNQQIIGKYEISFTEVSPKLSDNVGFIEINDNTVIFNTKVEPDLRGYKYSRQFIQKTPHYGIDISEIPESSVTATISSSSDDKRAFPNNILFGEFVYEITQEGSTGSAKAKKYMKIPSYYNIYQKYINTYQEYNSDYVKFNYKKHPLEIKPIKLKLPNLPADGFKYNVFFNGVPIFHLGLDKGCIRLYWNPDTTTELYIAKDWGSFRLLDLDGNILGYSSQVTDNLHKIDLPTNIDSAILYFEDVGFHPVWLFGNDVWMYGNFLPGPATSEGDALVYDETHYDPVLKTTSTITHGFYTCSKEDYEDGKSFGIFGKVYDLHKTITPYIIGELILPYYNSCNIFLPDGIFTPASSTTEYQIDFDKCIIPSATYYETTTEDEPVLIWNSSNSEFEVKHKSDVPDETINETETIGNLTINISSDSVFKVGEYWKFPINDCDDILTTDALEYWSIVETFTYKPNDAYWCDTDTYSSLSKIESSSDFSKYVFIPQDIELKIPNFTIYTNNKTPKYVAIYEMILEPDTSEYITLLLPKTITSSTGDELIVDTDTIIISDGMKIIPHEVSLYPDNCNETDIDIDLHEKYWKVKVDSNTLRRLYGNISHEYLKLQVYVYFGAYSKDELLPYEIKGVQTYSLSSNEGIILVELPFVIDGYISVTDGNTIYDFEILKTNLKKLSSDTDKGNLLFVKIPVNMTNNAIPIQSTNFNNKFRYSEISINSPKCICDVTYSYYTNIAALLIYNNDIWSEENVSYMKIPFGFFKLKVTTSDTNNNKHLLNLASINYSSAEYVSKYMRRVTVDSVNNTGIIGIIDGEFGILDYSKPCTLQRYIKPNVKTSWSSETLTLYKLDNFIHTRNILHINRGKLDKVIDGSDLTYTTTYIAPLTILETNNTHTIISRFKNDITPNLPVRTFKPSSDNFRILTKYYNPEDFEILPQLNDQHVLYPVSEQESPFYISVKSNLYRKPEYCIIKSDVIRDLVKSGFTNSNLRFISEETYNSLGDRGSGEITFVDSPTSYICIPTKNITIDAFGSRIFTNKNGEYTSFITQYGTLEFAGLDLVKSSDTSFTSGAYSVSWEKVSYVDILRHSSTTNVLLLSKEEIPVDKLVSFGKFNINLPENGFNIYPVIKIRNTQTNETILYAIDNFGRPINITKHYQVYKSNDSVAGSWLKYLLKNLYSYEYFNPLIEQYKDGQGTYVYSYGFIWESEGGEVYRFDGITIAPEFSDDSLYNEVVWCWSNIRYPILSDNKSEIVSDGVNGIVKIYNPNDETITIPILISLKKAGFDITQFTDGVIAKDENDVEIPCCYVSQYGNKKPTDNISDWNRDEVYVRVTLPPKSVTNIKIENGIPSYGMEDVFDFVDNFETLNKDKWEFSYIPPEYREQNWSTDTIDLGEVDTDGDGTTDAHEYGSEVGIFVEGIRPIQITPNNTLKFTPDNIKSIIGVYSKEQISEPTSKFIHVNWRNIGDCDSFKVEFGFGHTDFTILPSEAGKEVISRDDVYLKLYKDNSIIKKVPIPIITEQFTYDKFCFTYEVDIDISWLNDLRLMIFSNAGLYTITLNNTTSNSLTNIGIFVKPHTNDSSRSIEIDWIYMSQYYKYEPIVLYNEDVVVVIPERPITWYIVDYTSSSTPNKNEIQNIIDTFKLPIRKFQTYKYVNWFVPISSDDSVYDVINTNYRTNKI